VRDVTGSGWRLEVATVDLGADGAVAGAGRYDVTRAAKAVPAPQPQTIARLIGGVGSYEITLEVWVRV
jgi:hypothetical protein